MPKSILKPTDYQRDDTPLVTAGDWRYRFKAIFGYGYKEPQSNKPAADSTTRITQHLQEQGSAVEVGEKKSVRFVDDSKLATQCETYHKEDYNRKGWLRQRGAAPTCALYMRIKSFRNKVNKELDEYKQNEMEIHPQHFKLL